MKAASHFRVHRFLLAALFLVGLVSAFAFADDTIAESARPSLRLGKVTVLGPVACPAGATRGAICTSVSVACPAVPNLTATLSEASPTGTALGTIILANGGGGTTFFNAGFANTYLNDGFRVFQLLWASDWEDTNGVGVKSAACRPATIFRYAFFSVQAGSHASAFCAQGTSGGGASIGYSLAQYGMSDYFDYVMISGGPGVSRMDYGCDKDLYTGPALNLCPLLPNAPFAYTGGKQVNGWENTTTCNVKPPLQSDIDKWAADALVTPSGTYTYPKTGMSWYFCVTPPANDSNGQGKFLIDQVHPKNVPDVSCYSGACTSESVWQDKNAFNAMVAEMISQCVPNHR